MKEKELKELKLTKNIIIPFPNFQQNTIISPTQMNDNFEEIEHAYNSLIDNHNGALEKINKVLSDLTSSDNEAIVNEQERVQAEETRVQNEEQRISDEEERKTEETKRIAMYNTHLNDELRREQKHTEMVNTFDTKIGEVNTFVSTKKEEIDSFVDTKTEEVEEFVDLKTNQVNSFITTKTSEINAFVTAKGQEVQNAINAIPPKSELIGAKGDKGDKGDTPSITHLETSINNKINEVETRFNTLTSSQQQDAEVIDARVGENGKSYASLGDRLNEIDLQLAQVAINVKDFGAKGDGVTDDTKAIQDALDSMGNTSILTSDKGKTFLVTKPLNVKFDNINIDFNGSCIVYNSTYNLGNTNGRERTEGIFNVKGKEIGSNINVRGVYRYKTSRFDGLKLDLDNPSSIKDGSYYYLSLSNMEWKGWSKDFTDDPIVIRQMVRIFVIDGNIIVDYDTPFDISELSGTIIEVKPIRNVTIRNTILNNITPIADDEYYNNDTIIQEDLTVRNSWVGGISVKYGECLKFENLEIIGNYLPGLITRSMNNSEVINFICKNPRSISAGCGYVIQCNNSRHVIIRGAKGFQTRHIVDFSASTHCHVYDSVDEYLSITTTSYDCHGIGEHDISFTNCIGSIGIGNGINEFPMQTTKIKITNCVAKYMRIGACKEISIVNSEIGLGMSRGGQRVEKLYIDNCKVYYRFTLAIHYALRRSMYYNPEVRITNSQIIGLNEDILSSNLLNLQDFDKVEIINTIIDNKNRGSNITQGSTIDAKDFILKGCDVINTGFVLPTTHKNNYIFNNNNFIIEDDIPATNVYVINVNDKDSINLFLFENNVVIGTSVAKSYWLRFIGENGLNIGMMKISNNIMKYVSQRVDSSINCDYKLINNNVLNNVNSDIITQ